MQFPVGVSFPLYAPLGSVSLPEYSFLGNTTSGWYYDSVNGGPAVASQGSEVAVFGNGAGTPILFSLGTATVGSAIANFYRAATTQLRVTSDGGTGSVIAQSYGSTGATNSLQSATGTQASPGFKANGNTIGTYQFATWNGTTFGNIAQLQCVLIEPTPGATALGSSYRVNLNPLGSVTLQEVFRAEYDTGLSMGGANVVIDNNRIFRPRLYTVATLPAVTPTGHLQVSDQRGSPAPLWSDGSNWRNYYDNQVASSTTPSARGLLDRMTSNVSYVNQDIVHRTFQKLSDAGLLTKLLGLWVFAGAPASSTDALRNWITPGTRDLQIVGSPTWAQATGFTGDGASGLLNTNATVAQFGGGSNNFTAGIYIKTPDSSGKAVIGINGGASTRSIYLQSNTAGALTTRFQDGTNDSYTPPRYTGMFTLTRSGSTNYQASVDDSAQTTITRAFTTTGQILCFLGTSDATGNEFSNADALFAFCGTSMTLADIANLRAIMVDYYLVQVGSYNETVANLPPAANFTNNSIYVSDLGGGAGNLRSNGTNWLRSDAEGYETLGDADKTLVTLTNARNQNLTATLTANRTITLSGTDAKGTTCAKGSVFRIRNSGLGAFTVAIKDGPSGATLKTFASATASWINAVFDGTNWQEMADGNI